MDEERLTDLHPDGVIALVARIIQMAVSDYRRALIVGHETMKQDCENFFLGRYFESLTNLDGQALIEKVRRDTAAEKETRRKHSSK